VISLPVGIGKNTMRIFGEWKSLITLVMTVVSVAVPVWLWQADLSSKSLSVKLVTLVPLQPKEQESIPGMEISIDGSRLEKPHLVVFQIQNNGRKPILASDFESPLDIRLESKTSIVRSGVTKKSPKDIETTIKNEQQRISLKPALLNPKDTIEITTITSGAIPLFTTKARVVGISNVSMEDSTKEKPGKTKLALLFSGSFACLVAFALMMDAMTEPKGIFVRKRAAAVVVLVTAFPGVVAFITFLDLIGIQGFWYFFLFYMILMIPAGMIASALNRKEQPREMGQANEK